MPIENREIKSGVFADLFGDDEKDGKKVKTCPSFRSVISLSNTVSSWKLFSAIRQN